MNKLNNYKFFSFLLMIITVILFTPQIAQAGAVVQAIVTVVLVVVAVVAIAVGAGAIVAQVLLATAPTFAATLAATAVISVVMLGAGLWAADCLFDGGPIDPDIICVNGGPGISDGGNGGVLGLKVDIRANGSDGPISLLAPADFKIQWAISGADESTVCTATDDWSGNIAESSGETQMSNVSLGNYSFGIKCDRSSDGISASDSVIVNVNVELPECNFLANPTTIIPPQSSILSWSCQHADSCSIDGISVDNISGTKNVSPTSTTEYILTCSNDGGSRSWPATVKVLKPDLQEVGP